VDGIEAGDGSPEPLADLVAAWFARHIETRLQSSRRRARAEPDPPPAVAAYGYSLAEHARIDPEAEHDVLAWTRRKLAAPLFGPQRGSGPRRHASRGV
jgi:hypothetical protein